MKVKIIAAGVVVVIAILALAAFTAKKQISPGPVSKDNVGLVMLSKAMNRVGSSLGAKGDVLRLDCSSKGDGVVTCNAITGVISRVSFAADAGAPTFELVGQRAIDGQLYVNAFNGVPAEIPKREVDRFTSAFDGQATVQTE